jgi:hypothetical protein
MYKCERSIVLIQKRTLRLTHPNLTFIVPYKQNIAFKRNIGVVPLEAIATERSGVAIASSGEV